MNETTKITQFVKVAGCAGKVGPGDLHHLSSLLHQPHDPSLLVGFEGNEDAGVYQISPECALVQTADFITPVVNDPYLYGQIAAANSLSDVFAMGGRVKTALNLLMWDKCHLDEKMISEVLQGGLSKIIESQGILIGGHTIDDREQKYGLSVTGFVHPQKIWRNHTTQEGDALILTKPIGMGILTTSIKADMLSPQSTHEAGELMATLNLYAAQIASEFEIRACTDVTGFGLLGHALEMCGNRSIRLFASQTPYLSEALEMAKMGIIPAGSYANKSYLEPLTSIEASLSAEEAMLFYDAQTSGGLLFSLSAKEAPKLLEALRQGGISHASLVGEVLPRGEKPLYIG